MFPPLISSYSLELLHLILQGQSRASKRRAEMRHMYTLKELYFFSVPNP